MESTTRAKPKIFYTGTSTGRDFNTLKDVGEVSLMSDLGGPERAEVLWVDCATTKPDQYGPLLKAALDADKTLVMSHLDPQAREALSRIVDTRLEDIAETLVVSQLPTPSKYALTILGATSTASTLEGDSEPSILDGKQARHDWGAILDAHRDRNILSMGSPGLIPPQGVMYGMRTLSAHSGQSPDSVLGERGFNSSFYVYRENGGSNTDYVVIRVQQATFHAPDPDPFPFPGRGDERFWQFELNAECTHDRSDAPLLGASPDATSGPSILTQLSIPMHVKYLREGGCFPQYWSAVHGPVARPSEGWGLSNQSNISAGKAAWRHFHLAPWNSIDDPPADYDRWCRTRYDFSVLERPRLKPLNLLSRSTFTVENVAAWRFKASTIASKPEVKFTETLRHQLIAFYYLGVIGIPIPIPRPLPSPFQMAVHGETLTREITLNLVQVTEDISSPCR